MTSVREQKPSAWVLVVGRRCAGKTVLGQHLANDAGFIHLEASDVMRRLLAAASGPDDTIDEFAMRILSTNPSAVPDAIREGGMCRPEQSTVLTGLRSPREIVRIRAHLDDEEVPVLFVSASFDVRLRRGVRRRRGDGRAGDPVQLRQQDRLHENMGLLAILDLPGTTVIPNEGSPRDYFARVDRFLATPRPTWRPAT